MEEKNMGILEVFKKLDPENRADVLAHIMVAYAAQEHTKRHYGLLPESIPAQQAAGGKPAA